MCEARKQSKGKATNEGEKECPQDSHLSKTTDRNRSALTPSAQDIGERVSRWRASEEEQREFAINYPVGVIKQAPANSTNTTGEATGSGLVS